MGSTRSSSGVSPSQSERIRSRLREDLQQLKMKIPIDDVKRKKPSEDKARRAPGAPELDKTPVEVP